MIVRRDFLALAGAAAAFPRVAFAQQAGRLPHVALVTGAIAVDQMQIGKDVNWSAVIQEFANAGFVEGKNIIFDRYLISSTPETADADARRVLAGAPDAIFWGGVAIPLLQAALRVDNKTPMIAMSNDLVVAGVVANQSHPGANLTGISTAGSPSIEGKMVQLLAEAIPRAKTLAYLQVGEGSSFADSKQPYAQAAAAAASKAGLVLVPVVYAVGGGEAEFRRAFDAVGRTKAEMVVLGSDVSISATAQQQFVAELAIAQKLPTIGPFGGFGMAGGLLSYGSNLPDMASRAADYVVLALKGTKVGDLPVLEPTVFDFTINLKTAKSIGVTIPPSLLAQATQVIS